MMRTGVGDLTIEVYSTDDSTEIVKDALVRITGSHRQSLDKQVKLSANTRHLGFVTFADIPFDTYNVVVSRKPFEPIIIDNVVVNVPGKSPVGNSFTSYNATKIVFPVAKAYSLPNYVVNHIQTTTAHNRRPGTSLTPNHLTIHSTGNPNSTATGERGWLTNTSNTTTASYHIVVDENQAIECLPLNEIAWHAGDGSRGPGNTQSLSLEICESGDRKKTLEKAIILTAKLLRDRGWDETKLRKHHDWPRRNGSRKSCPRILLLSANRADPKHTWDWFKDEVKKQLGLIGPYYEELF